MCKRVVLFAIIVLSTFGAIAQEVYYDSRHTYTIKGIAIEGVRYYDTETLRQISGLEIGDEIVIPGDAITTAIKKFWRQGLFSDVKIVADKIERDDIWLKITLQERPKLSEVNYNGLNKSEEDEVREKVLLLIGGQITDNTVNTAERLILGIVEAKGYFNAEVSVVQRDDPARENYVILDINVDKKEKVTIESVEFYGGGAIPQAKLERALKKTKGRTIMNFFKSKKFLEDEFENDKRSLLAKYNEEGYRDAVILADSIVPFGKKDRVVVKLYVDEGEKYFFRDIKWVGNSAYPTPQLAAVLGIEKGEVFNQNLLDKRLRNDDDAVLNLYMNNGYLFSNIQDVELNVDNDSIDYEMRIFEGAKATLNDVIIVGNDQTHENVARRELRTSPGDLFSKSDIMRSIRELSNLGHFDPEQIRPVPVPNPTDGTVDLRYELVERSNDQIELSGGWGANMFVGTVGLKFANFSVRNIFNPDAWRPLPTGDGQQLSIKAQTNGSYYQAYNFSFVEPWLGGKKPNSLHLSFNYTKTTKSNSNYAYNGYDSSSSSASTEEWMKVVNAAAGIGYRVSWPDDFFTLYHGVNFTLYNLNNWSSFLVRDGKSHNLAIKNSLGRKSIDNPLFTRRGSDLSIDTEFTFPYSLVDGKDYRDQSLSDERRYKWIEYWKFKFNGDFFTPMTSDMKLILRTKFEVGMLGYYNKYKRSPFEQFSLGGDGLSGYNYYGSEVVGLRGYENNSLTSIGGGNLYTKYMAEVRYPIMLGESANVYALAFAEAGNSWYDFRDLNMFDVKRSVGAGVRVWLPMFGLMGFDWGYGFDTPNNGNIADSGSRFHFIIGQSL